MYSCCHTKRGIGGQRNWQGPAPQSLFWYGNNKDLERHIFAACIPCFIYKVPYIKFMGVFIIDREAREIINTPINFIYGTLYMKHGMHAAKMCL